MDPKIKYLVIRLSSIGDIVLTTPVVRCLKQQVDDAEVHFVTKEKFAGIVKANPYITKTFTLKEKLSDLLDELEKEQFDYIIDLHQNIRSNRIKSRLRIPAFSFNKLNYQKWLVVNFKVNKLPNQHIVDRYLGTLSVFDVKNDQKGLDFFIPENEQFNFQKLGGRFNDGYVAFVLAGTYYTKKLPAEKIIEICKNTDKPVLLLGGKKEQNVGDLVASEDIERIINLCGKTSLSESADLVKNARIVLTNDTGLMHIAAAYKKKILSFWGNTIPEFGMVPYLPDPVSKIMEIKNLKCRPCSKLGYEKCPKKHFRCMMEINIREVVSWIEKNF
ncbi:MAG: glycosyltransferase family 9 protein [Prolixibacteraceae bacterium]|nr:glycosyltransferase family 9 protein [Prolixibacteraceae bacterium]